MVCDLGSSIRRTQIRASSVSSLATGSLLYINQRNSQSTFVPSAALACFSAATTDRTLERPRPSAHPTLTSNAPSFQSARITLLHYQVHMILSAASIEFSNSMPASSLTIIPTTPARFTNPTRHDGRPGKLPAYLQGHQIGYDRCCLELQHVSFGSSLSHLRMLKLQVEDMPAMCVKGLGKSENPHYLPRSLDTPPQCYNYLKLRGNGCGVS